MTSTKSDSSIGGPKKSCGMARKDIRTPLTEEKHKGGFAVWNVVMVAVTPKEISPDVDEIVCPIDVRPL